MTPPEASERWGLKKDTVRAALTRGRFDDQIKRGLVRKSGSTWLIHEQAMIEVYGHRD
ncbi:helix-turn-helix domain-containing protein [Pullulanibacillus sp. KACC 23026]|uniref:helix-turn-helix domain-containing protein n=1 Tax=Pullulanibacillus sp. KACC 23026 TaxID=3028315 RepID=UPI0023AF39E5|nr:helix-turn-helix domain-containing protein [Pullulanibacillus sp. KACC 23026]WEG14909.1 helix-turn-helix domain-containing protein [Pullulanibacillus sp. KACC 23026]